MRAENADPAAVRPSHYADVCYVGQSYHLEVPLALDGAAPLDRLYRDFLAHHARIYGHSSEQPAKLVTCARCTAPVRHAGRRRHGDGRHGRSKHDARFWSPA